ncbi:LuxR family transcriptional regulator [Nesterenkonia flava]|uniref:LuxR family transcriptional regulator n=1 Tax=Nesterenkonia flava TaxID=469799 RepID=A0ABU1FVT7_9MICC|nr:LuxR family transcriptional regulator [Nesterenkonia flava]MDR5712590.1 LuxR family transcriptional regulator [Nesterenkonia flava]
MKKRLQAIGRDEEIAAIQEAAGRARAGRTQVVFVEGCAGTGKSTLVGSALRACEEWNELSVVLDDEHCGMPGYLIRHILLSFGLSCSADASADDLVELAQQGLAEVEEPTAIMVSRLDKVDDLSAQVLLRLCSSLQQAPILMVFVAQVNTRVPVRRLSDYVRTNLDGTHVAVEPYGTAETKQLLSTYLRTPLSEELVQQVHEETAGYPLLIAALGRHLAATPLGRRSLSEALRAMRSGPDWLRMRSAVEEILKDVDALTARLLQVLAAARTPLTRHQLDAAVQTSVDVSALLETGLARWDDTVLGYAPRNAVVAQLLLDHCSAEDLAEVHRTLTAVAPAEAMAYRVQLLRTQEEQEALEPVMLRLREAGGEALSRGDLKSAFDSYYACAQLRPDQVALADMIDVALPLGRLERLVEFEPALRSLPSSLLRQGALAALALGQGDLTGALEALETHEGADHTEIGALVYAQAVAETGMHLALHHAHWKLRTPGQRAVQMLTAWEQDLCQRRCDAAAEPLRARICGVRAFIRLWESFSRRDPEGLKQSVTEMENLLKELEEIPGTEVYTAGLRAMRATRLMQLGQRDEIYPDLLELVDFPVPHHFLLYMQTQLALLLFSAGYWEEAENLASRAAGRALLSRESSASLISYAVVALTRGFQGRWDEVAPLIDELGRVKMSYGPLVASIYDWVCACRVGGLGDHEEALRHLLRMRDEQGGWWSIGPEPMLLLARSAYYAKARTLGAQVLRSVLAGDTPLSPELSHTVAVNYLAGFAAWSDGDTRGAWRHLVATMRWFVERPPFRSAQPHYEGGAFRLLMAILALDMAELFIQRPQDIYAQREEARQNLEWAITVFRSCGAQALLERACCVVAAFEDHPGVSAPTRGDGVHTLDPASLEPETDSAPTSAGDDLLRELTKREKQVALRIAEGETNREIAEAMKLSVRTVDYHVSNLLAKLNLDSRREVRQLLRAHAGQ